MESTERTIFEQLAELRRRVDDLATWLEELTTDLLDWRAVRDPNTPDGLPVFDWSDTATFEEMQTWPL